MSDASKHRRIAVVCDYPGCGKSFNRLDLNRHKVNHTSVSFPCPVCGKTFKRRDILANHVARHDRANGTTTILPHTSNTAASANEPARSPRASETSASPDGRHERDATATKRNGMGQGPTRGIFYEPTGMNMGHGSPSGFPAMPPLPPLPPRSAMLEASRDSQNDQQQHQRSSELGIASTSTAPGVSVPMPAWLEGTSAAILNTVNQDTQNTLENYQPNNTGQDEINVGQMDSDWDALLVSLGGVPDNSDWWRSTDTGLSSAFTFDSSDQSAPAGFTESSLPNISDTLLSLPQQPPSPTKNLESSLPAPHITSGTLARLIQAFPDITNLATHPYMSGEHLSQALSLYWEEFHPQAPILHRPTFDANTADIHQLAIMCLIGLYHFKPANNDLSAISMHTRAQLTLRLTPTTNLTDYQTLILCHYYDEFMSTVEAQFNAQSYMPTLMVITRRKVLTAQRGKEGEALAMASGPLDQHDRPLEQLWRDWIIDEAKARAFYAILFLDSQVSSFWGMQCSRRHAASSNALLNPCPEGQWDAEDAQRWYYRVVQSASEPRQLYRTSLGATLHCHNSVPGSASPWARTLLLQGVTTVAWDLRNRFSSGLNLSDNMRRDWKVPLHTAITNLGSLPFPSETSAAKVLSERLYRDCSIIAIISLYSDLVVLQAYAKMGVNAGCPFDPRQREAAASKLKAWATTREAYTVAWHCAKYLQEVYLQPPTEKPSFASGWAVFLATISCFAFARLGTGGLQQESEQPAQQVVISGALRFLYELTSRRSDDLSLVPGFPNTNHFLAACQWYLSEVSPRWAVAQEAQKALAQLLTEIAPN